MTYHGSASGPRHPLVVTRDRRFELFTLPTFNPGEFPIDKAKPGCLRCIGLSLTQPNEQHGNIMQQPLRAHLGLRAMVETGTMFNTGSVDRPVPIHNPASESYYVVRTSYYCSAQPHPTEIRSTGNTSRSSAATIS
jgi:hypothetical protein